MFSSEGYARDLQFASKGGGNKLNIICSKNNSLCLLSRIKLLMFAQHKRTFVVSTILDGILFALLFRYKGMRKTVTGLQNDKQ